MDIWLIFQNLLFSFSARNRLGICSISKEMCHAKIGERNAKSLLNYDSSTCRLLESMKNLCIENSKLY